MSTDITNLIKILEQFKLVPASLTSAIDTVAELNARQVAPGAAIDLTSAADVTPKDIAAASLDWKTWAKANGFADLADLMDAKRKTE